MQRYTLNIEMFVYADNDKQAKQLSEKIILKEQKKYDNRCSVVELNELPFGSFVKRKII